MIQNTKNPFDVTKAVDFDDRQIQEYWVDLPGGGGFRDLVKPTSAMPMFVLGGKGSGKTHLLRYFSYPLQKLRHSNVVDGIREEGYVGVYLRCGGLNASRFSGKGQPADAWVTIFQQYMDIWLAQLFLAILDDALSGSIRLRDAPLCQAVRDLFDIVPDDGLDSLTTLFLFLKNWQRSLDISINNAAVTRQLDVPIRITPGRLVFGIPQACERLVPELGGVRVVYLIDELENLDETQQRYINTLIREKQAPCSFKVGARLYGVRTFETYSAGEINREGSEYEKLPLDDHLRESKSYPDFALRLCARRLAEANYLSDASAAGAPSASLRQTMKGFFQEGQDALGAEDRFLTRPQNRPKGKPYFDRLRVQLREGLASGHAPGLESEEQIPSILTSLTVDRAPLLEKVNVFLLYQAWSRGRNLMTQAASIQRKCLAYQQGAASSLAYKQTVLHFGADLIAQLLADYKMKQQYVGFDTFVEMSRGLPRNLLVLLKHVFQWAIFNGEQPFRSAPISIPSQQQSVDEAARWFFRDAEVLGEDGPDVQRAVRRLADLFRAIRFSDKPAECSLSTFAVDLEQTSPRARRLITLAEQWSLLLRIPGGQRDRNTGRLHSRFQLNSMICPVWDLPIYRRGTLALTPDEANCIFDPEHVVQYTAVVRARVARMTAPNFGRGLPRGSATLLPLTND
jgi:hypothetical protein